MSRSFRLKKNIQKPHVALTVAAILLIGILFYLLNYYTPLYADDYSYSFSFSTKERIQSVTDIVDSQIVHYEKMNGRAVTHTIAQLFLLLGDCVFNVVNTLFFLGLLFLIYFHACGTFKRFSLYKFLLIATLLFVACPGFGQSFLWITGAANYLYGIFILLCALVPYRLQCEARNSRYPIALEITAAIGFLPLGIIAGWTNENTAVAMIVIMLGYMVYFRLKSIKLHVWNITECVGAIFGCIAMLIAPGNSTRLDNAGGVGGIGSLIRRVVMYTCDMVLNLQMVLLLLAALIVIYLYKNRARLKCAGKGVVKFIFEDCGISIIYFIGFLASVYSMIVSPSFPARAWSGPIVFCLIALICMSWVIDVEDAKINLARTITLSFLVCLCFSFYIKAFFELKNVDATYDQRVMIIETAVASGEKSVELPQICGWSGFSCFSATGDLEPNSDYWLNDAIAQYYGLDEVKVSD